MSAGTQQTDALQLVGLQELKKNRGWLLALGILLILMGTVAICQTFLMTAVSMLFLGWLLIIGGVAETVHAFVHQRKWSGFFIDLLTGILYAVVGFFIVRHPIEAGASLTLLIAMFLIFGGIFRVVAAVTAQFPHWGWVVFHGIVQFVLGVLILNQWPWSGLWVIGLFIGIELLLNGWTLMMLYFAAGNIPDAKEDAGQAAASEATSE